MPGVVCYQFRLIYHRLELLSQRWNKFIIFYQGLLRGGNWGGFAELGFCLGGREGKSFWNSFSLLESPLVFSSRREGNFFSLKIINYGSFLRERERAGLPCFPLEFSPCCEVWRNIAHCPPPQPQPLAWLKIHKHYSVFAVWYKNKILKSPLNPHISSQANKCT